MTDEQEATVSAVLDEIENGPMTATEREWCAKQLRELIGAPPPFRVRFKREEEPTNAN